MGTVLNPGSELFRETVQSEIYVDKTLLIEAMNRVLGTRQKYVCVSRPRRFGKSIAADMLCAYYGRGESTDELFAPYKIARTKSFSEYQNCFDVFHLNMADFFGGSDPVEDGIAALCGLMVRELSEAYPEITSLPDEKLPFFFSRVYAQTETKFVFIIDEWDCIFRLHKGNTDAQKYYLDFLRNLLKDKAYVALAYMTGILPVKKYGEHSALNMFEEYSMLNAVPLSEFTGFTEDEVRDLCEAYHSSFEEMHRWYNGYQVDGYAIYNPKSVVSALLRKKYDSYWNATESYDALKSYIGMNMDGLRDKVTRMIAGAAVSVNTAKFQNDMTSFASADDILTLLVHLGYLTYDDETETVHIPNYEVSREFISSIEDGGWEEIAGAIKASSALLQATIQGDETRVAELLEQSHDENTSILKYNDENSLACVIVLAYYAARKDYEMTREMPAGKGYADMVFLPRYGIDAPAMIVELKCDKDAETAVRQIEERKYIACLQGYKGNVLLVGIGYDRKTKKHSCKIVRKTV